MEWVRTHPYSAAIVSALVLLLFGALIVIQHTSVDPSPTSAGLGTGDIAYAPTLSESMLAEQEARAFPASDVPIHLPPYTPADVQLPSVREAESFDFDSFLASLATRTEVASSADTPQPAQDGSPYEFIPTGLISMSAPQSSRTELQQALYEYGNNAGAYIASFESLNANIPQILKAFVEDRTDPGKTATLKKLADGLAELGVRLATLEPLPPEAASAHTALARAYRDAGAMLARVADATRESDFLNAILAYNGSADTLIEAYVSLASLLAVHGVTFDEFDPGSVFVFTSVGL